MRQLLPDPVEDVTPYAAYRPSDPHAEQVRVNMVASVDGRATDPDGRSAGLGGPGDLEVFRALRALADGIMAGAGTARAESYGAHRIHPTVGPLRRADGRQEPAAMVVVSRSLDLAPTARVFAEAVVPTIVVTCETAPRDKREALGRVARLVDAGEREIDLEVAIRLLQREHGLRHLLVEGGPTLNGSLLARGLVDELCVTFASQLVGGHGPGIAQGLSTGGSLELRGLLTDGRDLFSRYGMPGSQKSRSSSDSTPRNAP